MPVDAPQILLLSGDPDQDDLLSAGYIRQISPNARLVEVADPQSLQVALREVVFDLALIAYQLTWINGLEALAVLQDSYPGLPVIMVTSAGSEEIAVQGMKAGLRDYLSGETLFRLPAAIQAVLVKRGDNTAALESDVPAKNPGYRQFEADYSRSYQIVQNLTSAPNEIALLFDTAGKLIFVNHTFLHRFDKRPEDILGKQLQDIFPPELAQKRIEIIQETVRTGLPRRFEDKGMTGYFDNTVYPIFSAQGEVIQVVVLARDISERRQMEESLRRNQELLTTILNNVPVIIFAINRQGIFTLIDGQALNQLNIQQEQIFGKHVSQVFSHMGGSFPALERSLNGENVTFLDRSNGSRLYEVHISPLRDPQGAIIGTIGIGIDITEKQQVQDELQDSKRQLETILETAADGITVIDTRGRVVFANLAAARSAGFETIKAYRQGIGQAAYREYLKDEAGYPFPMEELPGGRSLDGQKHLPVVMRYTNPYNSKELWVLVNDAPILDGDGHVQGVVTVTHDISEMKQTQLALEDARQQLEYRVQERTAELRQANQDLQILSGRLLAVQEIERRNLACELHDQIGQMLTSLKLNLDMVSRALPAEDMPRAQQPLFQTGQILEQLLQQVRDLSLDLRPAMLDDLGLLPALLAHFDRYTAQTGIQVNFKHNGIDRRYSAPLETAAFRIIQEALTNAARHAEVEQVDVRMWSDNTRLYLLVQDEGRGFDFANASQNRNSTGISGMRQRASLLGGRLEIETKPGSGACLIAELPIAGAQEIASSNVDSSITRK
jgi:PAS domain S-box-containing protein